MCRNWKIEKGSKLALVTGASTGIGRQYAEQLAQRGYMQKNCFLSEKVPGDADKSFAKQVILLYFTFRALTWSITTSPLSSV